MRTAEELVLKYENMLYRVALTHTGIREDAEDMVQETFLRWLTARPEFESEEHEKAWLLRVVINLCNNLVKKRGRRGETELLDIYPAKTQEEQGLIELVMKLPPNQRDAIYLFYYEGLPVERISRLLDRRESTVRSDLRRGRAKLKELLERSGL